MEQGREVRVFGPPGTGKTTWMATQIAATARSRATDRLLVSSFTKAAAVEIAGRDLPLHRSQVGTLHALAYRHIGRPEVADEHLADWNSRHPAYALSGGWKGEDAPAEVLRSGSPGDGEMLRAETLRARQVPREVWPDGSQRFIKLWDEWKAEHELCDFTDMIERAIETGGPAPGNPLVGFFDEVQDFTPLELGLVRSWGDHMERVILAGDDDQCIYGFKGATPDAFLDPPIPDSDKRVLAQSWRVPEQVHAAADAWVKRLSRREPKEYLPRDAEGLVRYAALKHSAPDPFLNDIQSRLDDGKSVMILGTCSYMLDRLKHRMRALGIPFHNPYRASRGDWNPLTPARGVSSSAKLLAYLVLDERLMGEAHRLWTGGDVKRWASVVRKQGVFRRGANNAIRNLPDRELTYDEVAALFSDGEELARAVEPDLNWFRSNLLAGAEQGMQYPLMVLQEQGLAGLVETPRVTLGTIHSVKGGQADVVYLLPDLSKSGMQEWLGQRGQESQDSVVRQMYVGMTRAIEELVVCSPSSPLHVAPSLIMEGIE